MGLALEIGDEILDSASSSPKSSDETGSRLVVKIALALIIVQALDGLLTAIGISRFGIQAEGNPVLRFFMEEIGHITTLTIVKFTAILAIVSLVLLEQRFPWVTRALGVLTCVYILFAILPWTFLLFVQPLLY